MNKKDIWVLVENKIVVEKTILPTFKNNNYIHFLKYIKYHTYKTKLFSFFYLLSILNCFIIIVFMVTTTNKNLRHTAMPQNLHVLCLLLLSAPHTNLILAPQLCCPNTAALLHPEAVS